MKLAKVIGVILILVLTVTSFSLLLNAQSALEGFGNPHRMTYPDGAVHEWCDGLTTQVCGIAP